MPRLWAQRHLPRDGSPHLLGRLRFSLGPQATGHVLQLGNGIPSGRTEQNSIGGCFDELALS